MTKSRKLFFIKLLFFLLCCCIIISLAIQVYADDYKAKWNTYGVQIGKILRTLAMAGGALGIAYCAIFEYMLGDENTAAKGMNKILMIIGAEIALFILPYVIRMASSTNGIHAWAP